MFRRSVTIAGSLLGLLLVLYPLSFGSVINVPEDQPTIQAGINSAVDGDTVKIAPDAYTGDGNRDIYFNGKAIVVMSADGPGTVVIDPEGSNVDYHRGFVFANGEDSNSVLYQLTVTGAVADTGSGLLCRASSPRIVECEFRGCGFYDGVLKGVGAACVEGAMPTFERCVFEENYGDGGGGVAFFGGSDAVLRGCRFIGNHASCLYVEVVWENTGGAAFIRESAPLFEDCYFEDNAGCWFQFGFFGGGAVFSRDASPRFERCTFVRNWPCDEVTLGGGVLGFLRGAPEVINCTFYNNGAGGFWTPIASGGRCIGGTESAFIVRNCIFAYGEWSDISWDGSVIGWNNNSTPTIECNLFYGNFPDDFKNELAGLKNVAGNYWLEPRFCDTAAGDFHLKANSWASPENNPCGELIGAWPVDSTCAWTPCCWGTRGNVDNSEDETLGLGDLTAMIDHLFISFAPLNCYEEANMDLSQPEGPGSIGLGDLTVLIEYLFVLFGEPPPCP